MHAVRKHILEILKTRDGATVAELADSLAMAPVSVRHHLDILQGDNLIRVDRLERKGHVGRPQQVYALTVEANDYFPDNFAALAGGLVRQLKRVLPADQVACAFQNLAQEFAATLRPQLEGLSTEARLQRVTHFLNDRGYLARWEVIGAGLEEGGEPTYLIHKANCPYAGVSDEHHELCLMDQALINELMGEPCRRIQSMADDARCCTYRVGAGEELAFRPAGEPERRSAIALVGIELDTATLTGVSI